MDKFMDTVEKIWANSLVQAIVYLAVAFIAAAISAFIVKKLFKLFGFDKKFDKWGINEGESGTALKFIGKLVFLIVFLLFLPPALNALGLETVSDPITDFVSAFIKYIPNIIGALILIFVGVFVGGILSRVLTVLLAKTKLDSLTKKMRVSDDNLKLSSIIGKVVNAVIVLIATVEALAVLNIKAISEPAISIINAVFGAIPRIFLAGIVIAIGLAVANLATELIKNLLRGVGFDGMIAKMLPRSMESFSVTTLIGTVVRVLIIFFIAAESIEILGLSILGSIMNAIIAYLPMIIKALIIALVAFFGAGLLESAMEKALPSAKAAGKILKVIIYVVAGFMILSQLDFATTIVNWAFIIILVALAIAFALAFGLGGRDFAKRTLNGVNLGKLGGNAENNQDKNG